MDPKMELNRWKYDPKSIKNQFGIDFHTEWLPGRPRDASGTNQSELFGAIWIQNVAQVVILGTLAAPQINFKSNFWA